jgi:hypothetical protein
MCRDKHANLINSPRAKSDLNFLSRSRPPKSHVRLATKFLIFTVIYWGQTITTTKNLTNEMKACAIVHFYDKTTKKLEGKESGEKIDFYDAQFPNLWKRLFGLMTFSRNLNLKPAKHQCQNPNKTLKRR